MTSIDEIIDNFSLLDEWDDRYRYVIELGRTLPPLARAAHTEENKVRGCASQVWLLTHVRPDGAAGPTGPIFMPPSARSPRWRAACSAI